MKKTLITLLALAGVAVAALPETDTVLTLVANGSITADGTLSTSNGYIKWSEDIDKLDSWSVSFTVTSVRDSLGNENLAQVVGGVIFAVNNDGTVEFYSPSINTQDVWFTGVNTPTAITLTFIADVATDEYVFYNPGVNVGDVVGGTLTATSGEKTFSINVKGDYALYKNGQSVQIWTNSAKETYTGITVTQLAEVNYVPEPATATLSLLALCGLASRRRRK